MGAQIVGTMPKIGQCLLIDGKYVKVVGIKQATEQRIATIVVDGELPPVTIREYAKWARGRWQIVEMRNCVQVVDKHCR